MFKQYTEVLSVLLAALSALLAALLNHIISSKQLTLEKKEIEEEKKDIANIAVDGGINVIELMLKNVTELREYYIISKNQARQSFATSMIICFLGFMVYIAGIVSTTVFKIDISIITVISGTIVEIIAGLFFWLHNKSIKQLNIYHQRLGSTEKYLTVLQLIERIPDERKYDEYRNLINYILNDNQINNKVINNEI